MPQRAPVPGLARRPPDHRCLADRLQPSPATSEPSRPHSERVCNPVHQGSYGKQSPTLSDGITGATSQRFRGASILRGRIMAETWLPVITEARHLVVAAVKASKAASVKLVLIHVSYENV